MKDKVRIGYVGLGRRGMGMLETIFSQMKDVEITAICDLSTNRLEKAKQFVIENNHHEPILTTQYSDLVNNPDIDAIILMTGWSGRPAMAIESMRAGKYTAVEVGCADTLDECWDLIRTYEETGVPLMMLENCCYGRREMMVLNMVKQGLFGEIVHCSGGYHHYLTATSFFRDEEIPHYRLGHYREKNRENYPTHELGPISKVLNINRGNRMVRLSSFASKAVGIKSYALDHLGPDSKYAQDDYRQGDIMNTIVTCENGETILMTLDTTIPRAYYSRAFTVRGTKAMSSEERKVVFTEGMEEEIANNEAEMFAKYDHPLHTEYIAQGVKEGHDGMDWLVCRAFIESVKAGINTPIDAYDTVSWMAVGPLSEMSVNQGGIPVEFPDFTNGMWIDREPYRRGIFCLDEVCNDYFEEEK